QQTAAHQADAGAKPGGGLVAAEAEELDVGREVAAEEDPGDQTDRGGQRREHQGHQEEAHGGRPRPRHGKKYRSPVSARKPFKNTTGAGSVSGACAHARERPSPFDGVEFELAQLLPIDLATSAAKSSAGGLSMPSPRS